VATIIPVKIEFNSHDFFKSKVVEAKRFVTRVNDFGL
jgi:hypothetical protein